MAQLSPLFTWRSAIASPESTLPGTARHIALTLSLHMNERGGSAFPSVALLAAESGRCETTVRSELHRLVKTGWLARGEDAHRGGRGKYGHGTVYTASIPVRLTPSNAVPVLDKLPQLDTKPPQPDSQTTSTTPTKDVREDDKRTTSTSLSADADDVLLYWRDTYHKTSRLTPSRKAKILARLKRFSAADLRLVIDLACTDDWRTGDNDRKRDYSFPESFLRNDDITDQLLAQARKPKLDITDFDGGYP